MAICNNKKCSLGECDQPETCAAYVPVITNADKIRSMTDDELNDLFHEIYDAGVDDASSYEWGHRKNSFEWTMEWLQQPAEGE